MNLASGQPEAGSLNGLPALNFRGTMDYNNTRDALASGRLSSDEFCFDDSQLERLMRIERGQLTGAEAVAEIIAEREYNVG